MREGTLHLILIEFIRIKKIYQVLNFMYYIVILPWKVIQILVPINWDDVIKKEARGINDADLGEIQQVDENFILSQKGAIGKEKFYIPKSLVAYYDGNILHVSITEEEAKNMYMQGSSPIVEEEERIKIMEERIVVSRRETTGEEITIIKEPTSETKTVQVQLTHEESIIERNPVGEATSSLHPVQSIKEIKIPLMKEEIEVSKRAVCQGRSCH